MGKLSVGLYYVALALALAVALGAALAAAAAAAVAVAVALAVAFAGAAAFAAAAASGVGYAVRTGRGRAGYTALALGCIAAVTLVIAAAGGRTAPELLIAAFALGILPLVNAVFDYLSYGVTLTLLRKGQREGGWPTWACGLADAALAVALLFALSLSLALLVAAINALSPQPFLPLDQLLAELKDPAARGAYVWLYLSLLSTLVPTGAHLVLVLLGVTTWIPMWLKRRFIDWIEEDAHDLLTLAGTAGFALSLTFCAFALAALVLHAPRWIVGNFEGGAMLLLDAVTATLGLVGII